MKVKRPQNDKSRLLSDDVSQTINMTNETAIITATADFSFLDRI